MEIFMKHKLCCVLLLYLCLNLIINYNGVEGFQKTSVDHSRTAYHFRPPMHWINDPNAPMYYKGYYHLFYQYNPWGSTWASNLVWGHSYSKDLINWIPLEIAIRPSAPFDIIGAWSGSATILPGNKPIILYTGLVTKDRKVHQVQNIAFPKNSSDPLLREWIKPKYNPVIIPNKFMNASEFRDPTTAWYSNDGFWRVSIGHTKRNRGIAEVYKTRDFKTWTRGKRPLHSKADTGMWECPDFFPVSLKGKNGLETSVNGNHVKHILKVTFQLKRLDIYIVGSYNAARERFIPDPTSVDNSTGLRYDYGNVYATKSFFDEKYNRRILFGWSNESDTKVADIRKGWAGIQLIPRSLWLDQSGKQLIQWPIKELESIRGNAVHMKNVTLAQGSHREIKGITAAQADVEVTFNIPSLQYAEPFDPNWVDAEETCGYKDPKTVAGIGPFGLLTLASKNITSENITEYTPVYFHVFKFQDKPVVLMCSGGKMSSLDSKNYKPSFGGYVNVDSKARSISLRTLIDHSVVESFGAGGKTCITSRSYPTIAKGANTHLYLFNHGTIPVTVKKLDAWSMGNPQMN